MTKNFLTGLVFFALTFASVQCGNGSQRSKDINAPVRNSSKISRELAIKKNIDTSPQITADGSKVAFLSGRSGKLEGNPGYLRAYLFSIGIVSTGAAPNPKPILGEQDFGEEKEVRLSPGGSYGAIGFFKDSKHDLVIQFLIGDKKTVRVGDDSAIETQLAISADEKLLAYGIGAADSKKSALYIANVDVATQSIATPVRIAEVTPFVLGPVWSKGSNTVVVGRYNKSTQALEIQTISIADATQPATHTVSNLTLQNAQGTTPKIDRDGSIDTSADRIFFTERLDPDKEKMVAHNGDDTEFIQKYMRNRRIVSVPISGAEKIMELDPLGFSLLDFSVSKAGMIVTSVRQYIACKAFKTFAQGLQVVDTGADKKSFQILLPLLFKEPTEYKVSNDMCKFQFSEEGPIAAAADFFVRETVLNSDAIATKYTVVYSTNFSGQDKVLGDTELYVMTYDKAVSTGEPNKVFQLSPNTGE